MSDDVIITVSTDTSGVTQGMSDAAGKVKSGAESMVHSFDDVKDHVVEAAKEMAKLTIGAVTIEKVFELGKQSLETAENVDRMSQSLGFSVQTIQTLGYTAALTGGGGLESMRGALARLDRSAAEASNGNKSALASFQALGIGGTQLATLMKNPDDMLKTIVTTLSGFQNGANKTNLAMALMGRGAAEQIPLINKLGAEWDALKKHGEEIGVVLQDKDVKALADAEDHLNDLGQQVHGVANQMMIGLLPALNAVSAATGDLLQSGAVKSFFNELGTDIAQTVTLGKRISAQISEWKNMWNDYWDTADQKPKQVFSDIVSGLQTDMDAWERMKGSAQKAWVLIQEGGDILWAKLKTGFADFLTFMAQGFDKFSGLGFLSDKLGLPKFSEQVRQMTDGMRNTQLPASLWVGKLNDIDKAVQDGIAKNAAWVKGVRDQASALREVNAESEKGGKAAPGIIDPATAEQANKAKEAFDSLVEMIDKYATQVSDPVQKAQAELIVQFNAINDAADKAIKLGYDKIKVDAAQIQVTQAAYEAEQRKLDAIEKDLDVTGRTVQKLKDERDALGLTGESLFIYQKTLAAVNEAKQKNIDLSPQQISLIEQEAATTYEAKAAWDKYKEAADGVQKAVSGYFNNMADDFGKILTGQKDAVKNFKQDVVNDFKDMVGQIISQFIRLEVFGPILQGLLGFGGATGGSAISMAGGALFSGGLTSSAFGGGAGGVMSAAGATFMGGSAGSGGTSSNWMGNVGTGYQAYQMYNGSALGNAVFGGNTAGSTMFGAYTPNDPGMFGFGMNGGNFAPSALGWGTSIAGGVYAGYNRYQNSQGGFGGAMGGAAYGMGTTAVGLGVASMAAGGSFAAGVGALGALGPIGWAAIALMAVDMISGGKLFGTKGKFNFGEQTISTSASGATVTQGYDLKGQKAFFGGSTHKWVTTDADPAAVAAAQAFFDALTKQLGQIGTKFGVKAGEVIDASFTQTFDKHGNIKKHTSTVGGETFDEDAQHFQERVTSLSIAGTLDKLGIDVTAYVNQFKADADQMANAVQDAMTMLAAAKQDVDNGVSLLTGQKTIKDIWAFTLSAQQAGESLSQTYQRLEQATAQYRSIMASVNQQLQALWAGDDPGRKFAVSVEQIDEQTKQMIQQLNAAARAAGLSGAKEEDLARVHSLAASQAAAAMQQLTNAGLGLVDQLYGTGTLQGQIDAIEARANAANSAVHGFSDAMGQAAAAAQAAAQLMIGDLSPLNDQEKLQYALQAYQKGAINKDDVLQIGRRLYGTSQPYNDLFAQVNSMRGGIQNATQGGHTGGMSAGDQARVDSLQHQIDQQNRAMQANQLASVVATMMDAQGKTADQIADVLHFKLADLAKDLNMSQSELNDYLAKLEANNDAVPDSITSNTDRLIDVLERLLDPNYQSKPVVDSIDRNGHSTHQAIDRNTNAVHDNTDAVQNTGHSGHRSSRGG